MAEADQVGLHSDTLAWLDIRNPYREAYAEAFNVPEGSPAEAPDEAGGGCVVDVGGCPVLNDRFQNWPLPNAQNVEKQSAEGGWPSAEALYTDTDEKFKEGGTEQMEEIIVQQRQVNTLEGYRKGLLHKKYRRSHHLAALTHCLSGEEQSQNELSQLMLNEQVGTEANNEEA